MIWFALQFLGFMDFLLFRMVWFELIHTVNHWVVQVNKPALLFKQITCPDLLFDV